MNTVQHTKNLALWTGLWLITQASAAFGPHYLWPGNSTITWLAVALTLATGWGMVRANILHILSLDELQQRIQLESMGITLGLTLIVGLAYSLLDTTNLITHDAEISVLVIFMGLCYMANILLAQRRYA